MWRVLRWTVLIGVGGLVVGTLGCGPGVAEKDLGKVIYKLPKVPGAEKTYPLPQLDEKTETPPPAKESANSKP